MKTFITLFASIFLVNYAVAQNTGVNSLTINVKNHKINLSKLALSQPIQIKFDSCQYLPTKKIRIAYTYKAQTKGLHDMDCDSSIRFSLPELTGGKITEVIELVFRTDVKEPNDNKFLFSIRIDHDGKILSQGSDQPGDAEPMISDFDFVDPAILNAVILPATASSKYPRIEYDPCNNAFEVYNDGTQTKRNFIRYKNKITDNRGLTFFVNNFNTLKYNIAIGKEFITNHTEVPELFSSVKGIATTTLAAADEESYEQQIQDQLSLIIKLGKDLKQYLTKKMNETDCGGLSTFEAEKASIIGNVKSKFSIPPAAAQLPFDKEYQRLKSQYISSVKTPDFNVKEFNKIFSANYQLPITPDSIVRETRNLLTLLVSTKFEFQYNVPQLENADKIVFKVSINPKPDTNGSIHMTDELIEIPIRGGWKMDFSTGFYYSSIKNEQFGLRDVKLGDSVVAKDIVNEQGKNFGKHTAGVNALMHLYPRMSSFQPALTFGVGKSLDLNYSLLVGASILLGRDNHFVISGGLNYSNVKVLSNGNLDDKNSRLRVGKDVTAVNTYNQFKRGGFISITYALSAKKIQTAEAEKNGDK